MADHHSEPSTPRVEGWLLIMLTSFIPILLMALVPAGSRAGLAFLAGVPLVVGFGILIVKHWPKRGAARPAGDPDS